jgi:hypothetical protein
VSNADEEALDRRATAIARKAVRELLRECVQVSPTLLVHRGALPAYEREMERLKATKPEVAPCSIYFVQAASGPIKIGMAKNAERRVRALRTSSHEPLTLLASFSGEPAIERALHRRFASLRLSGEWFRPEPELLRLIDGIRRGERPA